MTYSQLATLLNEYAAAKDAWDEEVSFQLLAGTREPKDLELLDGDQGFSFETGVIALQLAE